MEVASMSGRRIAVALTVCIVLAAGISAVFAVWTDEGAEVCNAMQDQQVPQITYDGFGNTVIVWTDDRDNPAGDIYVQKLDYRGVSLWTSNGVAACTFSSSKHTPAIITDNAGGVYIAWSDYRGASGTRSDIYAQRIDPDGNLNFDAGVGLAVSTAVENQTYPRLAAGAANDCFITWYDNRSGINNIYAQRIRSGGSLAWATDGILIAGTPEDQLVPEIVTDNSDGSIIIWTDGRNGNIDIYAQRIDSTGTVLWTANGAPVCTHLISQTDILLAPDGSGGAFIAWSDNRTGNFDVYAQHINSSGTLLWTTDGSSITNIAGDQRVEDLIADGAGGCILSWYDDSSGNPDIYAQRVDASGTFLWKPSGEPVCTEVQTQLWSRLATDGNGGAYISWEDYRVPPYSVPDVYAQRLDHAGNALLAADGVALSTGSLTQIFPQISTDGNGRAVVVWEYHDIFDINIYAQVINRGGQIGYYPAPRIIAVSDVPNDQGGQVMIQWSRSYADSLPNTEITHYSVWRRLDDNGEYLWEWLVDVQAHHFETYARTVPAICDSTFNDTCWQTFMVAAHTADAGIYYDSAVDSGYSIDNLSPAQPTGLAGTQSFDPAGLQLSWEPNAEPDIHEYSIYRGLTDDFTADPYSLVGSTAGTSFIDEGWDWDAGYFYKVSATDNNGNESLFARVIPDELTGEEVQATPGTSFLAQNFPNPFNPSTTIRFSLAKAGHVNLSIFDASGRLVRVLVNEYREAAIHEADWNGLNDNGATVGSGIYFSRLTSGELRFSQKMIMLR
jgi:hypothetical protein